MRIVILFALAGVAGAADKAGHPIAGLAHDALLAWAGFLMGRRK